MATKNFSREIKELEPISKKLSGTIPDVDKREILFHLNKLKTTLEIMENSLSGNPKKKCRELISITDKHLSKVTTSTAPSGIHPSISENELFNITLKLDTIITWLRKQPIQTSGPA